MTTGTFNKRDINTLTFQDAYLQKAQSICRDWLNGREYFTLTTSGSTGTPRPIQVSASQLRASVHATSQALSLYEGTKTLACLNIDYVAGFMMLIRAMELDWEVTVIPPVANPLLSVSSEMSFDFTSLVPMQLTKILSDPHTKPSTQKLGKILLGGVGLTPSQTEEFGTLSQEIFMGYGMTETVSHVALRKINDQTKENNIYYLTGDVAYGTDSRGCLFFKGAVTDGQTVQTNDQATLLPTERAFILLGRIDNVINSGGLKIQLEEMESLLHREFRKVGITNSYFLWKRPDSRLGSALVLIVEGDPALESKISDVFLKHIDRRKRPKEIYFTDSFLKTGSDKIDKGRTFEKLKENPLSNPIQSKQKL